MPSNVGSRERQYSLFLSYSCRDNTLWKSISLSPILLVQRISTLSMVIHMYLCAATVSQGPGQACRTSERTRSRTYSGAHFSNPLEKLLSRQVEDFIFFVCSINPSSTSSNDIRYTNQVCVGKN